MAPTLEHHLRIITLNCQGLRTLASRDILFSWLNCCLVDIVCLQETHALSETEFASWLSQATAAGQNNHNFRGLSSPGTNRSSGVAVLYTPRVEVVHNFRDDAGRLLAAEFSFHNYFFTICNIYAPNTSPAGCKFFESLYSHLDTSTPTILCGDFNTVPDATKDRRGCNPSSPWAYNWSPTLHSLMETYDLHDIWRLHHPDTLDYTWRRPNGKQASRLDMFWISALFLNMLVRVDICPFFRSDHSSVFLELRFSSSIHRGPGIWKFNTNHLRDPTFVQMVNEFWRFWQSQKGSFFAVSAWWDAGKARLREHIQLFCRTKASAFKRKLRTLDYTLKHLQRRETNGESVSSLLQEVKAEIAEMHRQQARGARIRAQIQWAEEGERSSAFFLRLEIKKGQRRLIHSIQTLSGIITSSFQSILAAWVQFYSLLLSTQPLHYSEQTFFLNHLRLKLTTQDRDLCEGILTNAECKTAVDAMAHGKSPGIDGLPVEFYQAFWELLGDDLVEVLNSCYEANQLSASQRSGIITLLYKKGNPLYMSNWRPITLLCVDYKIAAKALANRLLLVIHLVTHPNQSCGVPGRNASASIRVLKDIVSQANSNHVGGAILSLDQEKAFDRVEWSYLHHILTRMNFGPSFRAWITLFYSQIKSSVLVNGELSAFFSVSRGLRQGCPLSPLLYILVAETIASAIRHDSSISGYTLPNGTTLKLCQYADDTSVVLTSISGIHSLFRLFHRYETASGAKLNVAKSHGLLLGPWRSRNETSVHLSWSTSHITVLGASLSSVGEEIWDSKIHEISTICASWQQRSLSFHGRAIVINSLALSKLWYLATNAVIPDKVIQPINQIIFRFVWNKKREWLARTSVTQPPRQGGLGVVDIAKKQLSLHFLWVKRFIQDPQAPWSTFFHQYLTRAFPGRSIHEILLLPHPPKYAMDALPHFYRSVMTAWFSLERRFQDGEYFIYRSHSHCAALSSLPANFVFRAVSSLQRTKHRCVEKYHQWGVKVDWPTVWRDLYLWRFTRSIRDTSWLIAHGVLPTADRLLGFGMNVDPLCDCGQNETLLHLFVTCPFAKHILTWYRSILQQYRPQLPPVTTGEILVGYASDVRLPPVFSCLLGVIRHSLWLSRNQVKFDHRQRKHHDVIQHIKSSLRFIIRIQQRHCLPHSFSPLWLADGIFGLVSAGRIIFSDVLV